ncbi:MAG TPA: hypothetical protein VFB96_02765 [Pirellulaceae bacterium]|nr:hypothetical protein [Pirellulaceae bacterium]
MRSRPFWATVWCLLLSGGTAYAVDVSALAADLDSDQFERRENAEQALLQEGLSVIDQTLGSEALPERATDADIELHFQKSAEDLKSALEKRLFRHLAGLEGLEPRYRADRIRKAIERAAAVRFSQAKAKFPSRLPKADAERVYGNTGGFRDGTTWFDAEFHNDSSYTVTSIQILVRITDKRTGEKTEKTAVLGRSESPLRPGDSVTWSSDVGMAQASHHEFFWDTRAVFGTPPIARE